MNGHGDLDTCIVIRSAFVQHGKAHIQAGWGCLWFRPTIRGRWNPKQSQCGDNRNTAIARRPPMSHHQDITLFLLDNVDSFTYNLVDELRMMGIQLHVYRNTIPVDIIIEKMEATTERSCYCFHRPGAQRSRLYARITSICDGKFPILGICLVIKLLSVLWVKLAEVGGCSRKSVQHHAQWRQNVWRTTNPLPVARYHSLMATETPNTLIYSRNTTQSPWQYFTEPTECLAFNFIPNQS